MDKCTVHFRKIPRHLITWAARAVNRFICKDERDASGTIVLREDGYMLDIYYTKTGNITVTYLGQENT